MLPFAKHSLKTSAVLTMLVGYARSANTEDSLATQVAALKAAGCRRIHIDDGVAAGARHRPQFTIALAKLRRGDTLAVHSLDRLGGTAAQLLRVLAGLHARGVTFRSLSEELRSDQVVRFDVLVNQLATVDRSLVAQQTTEGRRVAARHGVLIGRRPKLTAEKLARATRLIDAGMRPSEVASDLGVSLATLYRAIPAPASSRATLDLFRGGAQ